jgi:hypothetical protein
MTGAMFREQACRIHLPLEHQPGIWTDAQMEMDYYRKFPKRHLGPYYGRRVRGQYVAHSILAVGLLKEF